MTLLKTIEEDEATGLTGELYKEDIEKNGFVSPVTRVFSLRPEALLAWRTLDNALTSNMDARYYELATIVATVGIRSTA